MPKVMLEMEMPKSCDDCSMAEVLFDGNRMRYICRVEKLWDCNNKHQDNYVFAYPLIKGEKYLNCPLKEVK
jgi:hypothetical protein